jgi:hypothetical protein
MVTRLNVKVAHLAQGHQVLKRTVALVAIQMMHRQAPPRIRIVSMETMLATPTSLHLNPQRDAFPISRILAPPFHVHPLLI